MAENNFINMPIIIIFLFFSLLNAQARVGEWNALTSVMEVRDLTLRNDTIYAATEGGIFEIINNEYSVYTTIDGLKGVDLSTISMDFRSQLWIGGNSPFGFIQVYDPLNRQSINNFDFGLSAILDIQFNDNSCWVLFRDGQELGLMKFLFNEDWQYRDSYGNYPIEAGDINCFAVNDSIVYLGMTNGLFSANRANNLKDPNRWQAIDDAMDFEVTSATFNDLFIVFSSKTSLYELSILSGNWEAITFSYSFSNITEIIVSENDYWIIDQKKLYRKSYAGDTLLENRYWLSI